MNAGSINCIENNFDLTVIIDDNFYKRSKMSVEPITLYCRSTDGKGERIALPPELPASRLYEIVGQKMSRQADQIKLYLHGK